MINTKITEQKQKQKQNEHIKFAEKNPDKNGQNEDKISQNN